MTKCLNCSKFNESFHPLNALVEVNGYLAPIESHTTYAKRIRKEGLIVPAANMEEAAEYPVVGFVCNSYLLPFTYFPYYVGLLWHKYLSQNPELVEELKQYDEYRDFNQFTDFSHAQYIERFMDCSCSGKVAKPNPGDLFYEWLKPLTDVLTGKNTVIIEKETSIRESITEVVGFFQHEEDESSEWSEYYREFCPIVYRNYKKHLSRSPLEMFGGCFVQDNDQSLLQRFKNHRNKTFVNDQQKIAFLTLSNENEELDFRTSIQSLKTYAQKRKLAVSLPYHLGCQVESKKWKKRYAILKEIFADYYVTLFQEK